MGGEWDLDAVGAAFTDAAIDPSRWDAAMEVAAAATQGFGAALLPVRGRLPSFPVSRSLAGAAETYIREGWVHRDERYRGLPAQIRKGVAVEFDFITLDEIKKHPYYQEFLAPHGLRWFAGINLPCGDDLWTLSIQRSIVDGPFSLSEQKRLAELSVRLSGTVALARALGFARVEAAVSAFELSGSAVVLLDRCAEVLRVNNAAERLLGADLRIVDKRLASCDHKSTAALDRALHALLWARTSEVMPPVALPRVDKRPVLAYPLRLAGAALDVLCPCQALVVLVDLDARRPPPEAALRMSFGLTEAEARLAARLATGASLERAADDLGITYQTGRNQLKAVFAKTDTHRQVELVSMLARLLIPPGQS